jgi:hypothetical protein
MGLRDLGRRVLDFATLAPQRELATAPSPRRRWGFDTYAPVDQVIAEMWDGAGRVTQDEALTVPGVLRARNIIAGGLASWPLVLMDDQNRVSRAPLLDQIDPQVTNIVTIAQTIQDLLFEGISWWRVLARDRDGFPLYCEHLDFHSVTINPPGDGRSRALLPSGVDPRRAQILVDGQPVSPLEIKRFDSPNPGVLRSCGAVIKLAATYGKTSQKYANNPRMHDFFTPSDPTVDPLEDDEDVADLLADWEDTRRKGTTGYVPAALKYNTAEQMTPADQQLAQLQELATKHVATALGLDAEDLNVSTTSRTYANDSDRRQDRINDTLQAYVTAFTQRMSMNDMTRRGKRVVARSDTYMRADPVTRSAFAETMFNLVDPVTGKRAMTIDEIRDREELPPAAPGQAPPVAAGNVVPIRSGGSGTARVAAAAEGSAAVTFAADGDPVRFHLEPVAVGFQVDVARRTISGIAVPYGPTDIGRKGGRKFRFQQGSIVWPADLSRVKLLVDHVFSSPVGHATALEDTPDGLLATFKVGTGADGDQVLAWAAEKVRDGLSVGVDFDADLDCIPDPLNPGVLLVKPGAALGVEISNVAMPAFDRARVATVVASSDGGNMHCSACGTVHAPGVACPTTPPTATPPAATPPAASPVTFSADQVALLLGNQAALAAAPQTFAVETPAVVDPLARPVPGQPATPPPAVVTIEAAPYRFDRDANLIPGPEHDFSADLVRAMRDKDHAAYQRALGFMREMTVGHRYGMQLHQFADVDRADLAGVNPVQNRPDLYVDQRDYAYPLTRATRRGSLDNITAFVLPKFNSASGLVAAHTEGVEPTGGTLAVTTQTITPTAKSGAIDMTREAWDQGGNPQATAIIWRQFLRTWNEALEQGVATFLNTLTAATDITLTAGATNKALAKAWRTAVARLQFARGGAEQFDVMAAEQELYVAMAVAETDDGEPIYPMIGPTNRDGTAQRRFRSLEADGVTISPAWALASTAGSPNNSWLFDSTTVHTWDTGPQRLEFPGIDADGDYAPVAYVRLACWGYQALANTDINGVRQVIYDTVA